ncbi:hypothetical protein [Micromonospora sp. LOL_024]|uniref:hypothetical protein n=1 Tax=Micromonospora sp. LOL_024 TaxID=3345412 RepID=UPI003A8C1026
MSDEIVQKLRQLSQYTADLRSLIDQVQARSPHAPTIATDPSGAVRIRVDATGLPESIQVEPGWQWRVQPQQLSECVLLAYQEAARQVMQSLAAGLTADGWHAGTEQAEARRQHSAAVLPPPSVYGQPRDPLALAEEVMKALETARAGSAAVATDHVGQAGRQNVSVTLSTSGLQSCSITPAWAARHSAASINDALGQALRSARSALSDATSRHRIETKMLDTLAGEALATLASITETTDRRKET